MKDSRFAVYLIPPYPISKKVSEVHYLLRKQFGFAAADRFPAHCTVKGFFKKNDLPARQLQNELDKFFQTQPPIPVSVEDLRVDPIGFGLSLMSLNGKTNTPFLKFRDKVVDITRPFIADDCDFKEHDLGREYHPHITFSFRDIPNEMYDHILKWVEEGPDYTGHFMTTTFHFLEFFSEDWSGSWWESISWRLLHTWRLES
jgi:2'-5' RNA ligase